MTKEAEKKITEIGWEIRGLMRDASRVRQELNSIEDKIAALDAERWQIVLTP